MIAKGIHQHPEFKLGKSEYKEDPRTLKIGDSILNRDIQIPTSYDFDANRTSFKDHMWGNNEYGDCVIADRANHVLRFERLETRRTPGITDDMVIDTYKAMTGCVTPGDSNDTGLIMLDALANWRAGWPLKFGTKEKNYTIAAFGSINPMDRWLLRACNYLFTGIDLGFSMPLTAQRQTGQGVWDVVSDGGWQSEPGSWGGHAVYSKKFDTDGVYVLTWGREVKVTNAFIEKYCDEAWTCIDNLDPWRTSTRILNVDALIQQLKDVGVTIQS